MRSHADKLIRVQGNRDLRRPLSKVSEAYAAIDYPGDRRDEAPDDVLGVLDRIWHWHFRRRAPGC